MIGNDIVDLAQAKQESNWQRKGFLAKLFTDEEQQYIHTSPNPERMVWTLWSMKESVYKAILRETGERVFAPKKIPCQLTSWIEKSAESIVFHEKTYRVKTSVTQDYIASIALLTDGSSTVESAVFSLTDTAYTTQSSMVRTRIVQHCAELLSVPEHLFSIQKNLNGIPTLHISNTGKDPLQIPISISHHGHYGAYVIGLSVNE
ncbi:hypothetical protein GCM10028805_64060 [Spirosoma harenae]